jgi:hypothetical protein
MAARFAELLENELSCLLEEKNAENKKATKTAVIVFRQNLYRTKINQRRQSSWLKRNSCQRPSQVLCRSKKERRRTYIIKRKIK